MKVMNSKESQMLLTKFSAKHHYDELVRVSSVAAAEAIAREQAKTAEIGFDFFFFCFSISHTF
jgi:hypothetical protein